MAQQQLDVLLHAVGCIATGAAVDDDDDDDTEEAVASSSPSADQEFGNFVDAWEPAVVASSEAKKAAQLARVADLSQVDLKDAENDANGAPAYGPFAPTRALQSYTRVKELLKGVATGRAAAEPALAVAHAEHAGWR